MGLERLELSTPRLSSVCSNQLSYRPFPVALTENIARFISENHTQSHGWSLKTAQRVNPTKEFDLGLSGLPEGFRFFSLERR